MVERKRRESDGERIKKIRVYLDELEAVVNEARSRSFEVTISDEEYIYDSVAELVDRRGRHPEFIEFDFSPGSAGGATVSLKVEDDSAWLFFSSSNEDPEPEAFWYWLHERVRGWVPRLKPLLNTYAWGAAVLVLVNIDASLLQEAGDPGSLVWLHLITGVSAIGWLTAFGANRLLLGTNLYRRHEAGFWTRNKERITTLAIGTALGGLVVFLLQQIL